MAPLMKSLSYFRKVTMLFSRNSLKIRCYSQTAFERTFLVKPTSNLVLEARAVPIRVQPTTSNATVKLACDNAHLEFSVSDSAVDGLKISILGDECDDELLVLVPVHFASLSVSTWDARLTLHNVYTTANFVCFARNAEVRCESVKCGDIAISSDGGDINCIGSLVSTAISIETSGKGTVKSTKGIFHANKIDVRVEDGDVDLAALYNNSVNKGDNYSSIEARNSRVRLANVHGNCQVNVAGTGNLNIIGLDGSLRACVHRGVADVQISRLINEASRIHVDHGNVLLKFADDLKCRLRLEGLDVIVADEGGRVQASSTSTESERVVYEGNTNGANEEEPLVCASALNGTITTSIQSWANGLKTIVENQFTCK